MIKLDNKVIEKLAEYINYFEDENKVFYNWYGGEKTEDDTYIMPYIIYDEKLHEFIKSVYESGIMMEDYLSYLERKFGKSNDMNNIIKNADFETLCAVLTYLVRQERFHDGLWSEAIRNKYFLKILCKFKEIV